MHVVVEIAAWSAAAALLTAYALLSRGRISGQGTRYQTINVVGSAVVGLNSLVHGAWPSVGVNAMWLIIGVITLAAAARRHQRSRAADDRGRDLPGHSGDVAGAGPGQAIAEHAAPALL